MVACACRQWRSPFPATFTGSPDDHCARRRGSGRHSCKGQQQQQQPSSSGVGSMTIHQPDFWVQRKNNSTALLFNDLVSCLQPASLLATDARCLKNLEGCPIVTQGLKAGGSARPPPLPCFHRADSARFGKRLLAGSKKTCGAEAENNPKSKFWGDVGSKNTRNACEC